MKRKTPTDIITLLIFLLICTSPNLFGQPNAYHPNQLIVRQSAKTDKAKLKAWKDKLNAKKIKTSRSGFELWELPASNKPDGIATKARQNLLEILSGDDPKAKVDGMGLNYILETPASPREVLEYLGLDTYTPFPSCTDLNLAAPREKSRSVVRIGIIDSGIDELIISRNFPNVTINYTGRYNYVTSGRLPVDSVGHGTEIAGIIAGVLQRWRIPQAEIIPFKIVNTQGQGNVFDLISAIEEAAAAGVQVLNISLGFTPNPRDKKTIKLLQTALDAAGQAGVISLVAAGNQSSDNDSQAYLPASLKAPNKICVAATECAAGLTGFSNYGRETVDFAAPGADILCPTLGGYWIYANGTSYATAVVSGIAAALGSTLPEADMSAVYCALKSGVLPLESLASQTIDGGIADGTKALAKLLEGCSASANAALLQPASSTLVVPDIHLYPNPAADEIRLEFKAGRANTRLRVIDALGQVVHTRFLHTEAGYNEVRINLQHLSKGTYYISCDELNRIIPFVKH